MLLPLGITKPVPSQRGVEWTSDLERLEVDIHNDLCMWECQICNFCTCLGISSVNNTKCDQIFFSNYLKKLQKKKEKNVQVQPVFTEGKSAFSWISLFMQGFCNISFLKDFTCSSSLYWARYPVFWASTLCQPWHIINMNSLCLAGSSLIQINRVTIHGEKSINRGKSNRWPKESLETPPGAVLEMSHIL